MSNLSFRSFDPRSFEQFTQALAAKVLGPGILIFGDGPDGGREASYNGRVPYPTEAERWNGYIVLQAKFKLKPKGDASDATWLAAQIKKDLDSFKAGSKRPPPEYYIIATNVELSGVVGERAKGGQQKIEELFESYKHLGIKGFRTWHPDVYEAILADHPGLRRSYACWLKPQDVLAEVFDYFESKRPDFRSTMLLLLQRELRDHRGMRLQQAGHVGDSQTHLERVFTDLPFLEGNRPSYLFSDTYTPSTRVLKELLCRSSHKLDPMSLRASVRGDFNGPAGDRYLILGGPGQGKSTVTQFLAQVLRTRILRDEKALPLNAETGPIIDSMTASINEAGLDIEGAKRFPIRIELPKLADALSKGPGSGPSLLDFIAKHIEHVTKRAVDCADLRSWLTHYPWALLLDGLDEVPPAGARPDVIRCMREFWDEANSLNADVMMVVTTRPQGYNDDLGHQYYGSLELSRLDDATAVQIATRLAKVKLSSEDDRARVVGQLTEATQNITTRNILISPLQVAILFALIDQGGSVPRDRWSLFHDYFGVVVKREQEKFGEVGTIVKERIRPIVEIVLKSGFILHTIAEGRGGADAYLTVGAFRELVEQHLLSEGHEGESLTKAIEDIQFAATERLVFLEQRVDGKLAFDVRSLQEYSAAAYLMSGPEARVQARLREISNRSHWQHVFKIAASKCFAAPDAAQYRDTVVLICDEINSISEADRVIQSGSKLALELLQDGLAADIPIYQKTLAKRVISLTQLGPDAVAPAVVEYSKRVNSLELRDYLIGQVRSGALLKRQGAWKLLLELSTHEKWAEEEAFEAWPPEQREGLELAFLTTSLPVSQRLWVKCVEAIRASPPNEVRKAWYPFRRRDGWKARQLLTECPFLHLIDMHDFSHDDDHLLRAELSDETSISAPALDVLQDTALGDAELPPAAGWSVYKSIMGFCHDPKPETLASALESCFAANPFDVDAARTVTPWPLRGLWLCGQNNDLQTSLPNRVRAGEFGDLTSWQAAEERHGGRQLSRGDFEPASKGLYFDERVATLGFFEPQLLSQSPGEPEEGLQVSDLVDVLNSCSSGAPRESVAWMVKATVDTVEDLSKLTTESAVAMLFEHSLWDGTQLVDLGILNKLPDSILEDRDFARSLALGLSIDVSLHADSEAGAIRFETILRRNAGMLELLPWYVAATLQNLPDVISPVAVKMANSGLHNDALVIRVSSAIILALSSGEDRSELIQIARGVSNAQSPFLAEIIKIATRDPILPYEFARTLLEGLLECDVTQSDRMSLQANLSRLLGSRRSLLITLERWRELGFSDSLHEFMLNAQAERLMVA